MLVLFLFFFRDELRSQNPNVGRGIMGGGIVMGYKASRGGPQHRKCVLDGVLKPLLRIMEF